MKKENVTIGMKVLVFAAFPDVGAYYQNAEAHVIGQWQDDGQIVENFYEIHVAGSNDTICAHYKQLKEIE